MSGTIKVAEIPPFYMSVHFTHSVYKQLPPSSGYTERLFREQKVDDLRL